MSILFIDSKVHCSIKRLWIGSGKLIKQVPLGGRITEGGVDGNFSEWESSDEDTFDVRTLMYMCSHCCCYCRKIVNFNFCYF